MSGNAGGAGGFMEKGKYYKLVHTRGSPTENFIPIVLEEGKELYLGKFWITLQSYGGSGTNDIAISYYFYADGTPMRGIFDKFPSKWTHIISFPLPYDPYASNVPIPPGVVETEKQEGGGKRSKSRKATRKATKSRKGRKSSTRRR